MLVCRNCSYKCNAWRLVMHFLTGAMLTITQFDAKKLFLHMDKNSTITLCSLLMLLLIVRDCCH